MSGSQRSYDQRCGLALSMDLLGERWTLLILRELARGPKRFKDLGESLHGIGTNLLSARLRSLEEGDVVRKGTLPPPASVSAYELTDRGESLLPILEDLALWGIGLMPPLEERQELTVRAAWTAMTMKATMDRDSRRPPEGLFEFKVGEEEFWLSVRESASELRDGVPPIAADVTLHITLDEFMAVASGAIELKESAAIIDGDRGRLESLLETFRIPVERVPA